VDGRLEGWRRDDESQPENRRQRLGEAADVDHRLLVVEGVWSGITPGSWWKSLS
jgi:hypothetical protein